MLEVKGLHRFGVYKVLPAGRIRAIRPMTRLLPTGILRLAPPVRLGEVEFRLPGAEATGEIWVASRGRSANPRIPKGMRSCRIIGLEGLGEVPPFNGGDAVITNGDAVELLCFLDLIRRGERPVSKLKVALGGVGPAHVSTLARLLAREIGEMILIGQAPYLRRLAGQIIAETGLAVRIRLVIPPEGYDYLVWCGAPPMTDLTYLGLFQPERHWRTTPGFNWEIRGWDATALAEGSSFAAAEAWLLAVGDWKSSGIVPGRLSVGWVGHIAKLQRETGFRPLMEALDTPTPVGYNDNNF